MGHHRGRGHTECPVAHLRGVAMFLRVLRTHLPGARQTLLEATEIAHCSTHESPEPDARDVACAQEFVDEGDARILVKPRNGELFVGEWLHGKRWIRKDGQQTEPPSDCRPSPPSLRL